MEINPVFHSLIPPLQDGEFQQLEANIVRDGCRDPLVVWNGVLIDGHNRYKICTQHGIRYKLVNQDFGTEAEAKVWIIKNQFGRRNLQPYQRAELSHELEKLIPRNEYGQNSDRIEQPLRKAADLAQMSHDTYAKTKVIAAKADDEVKQQLRSGEKSIHAAYKETLRKDKPLPVVTPPLEGKYRCIVADPPWPIVKIERDLYPDQGKWLDYATMTVDEIAELKVPADDQCHLYLWVTQKYLPAGLAIMKSWGFAYQCVLTWVKPTGFTPFSWMYNTEHVLFGSRGGLRLEQLGVKLSFDAAKGRHSEKPGTFYDIVRKCSPGPRLDMFSREVKDGFTTWGAEAPVAPKQEVVGSVHA